MRRAWLPLGLVVLAGVAGPLACGQAFTFTDGTGGASASSTGGRSSTEDATATGTSTSTSTSTTVTSTGTGNPQCVSSSDCPGDTTVCGKPICVKGKCGWLARSKDDGKSSSQVYGDCHDILCTKGQATLADNNKDFYDDGNECTDDACVEGKSMNTPRDAGEPCGSMSSGKVCDGNGACVACATDKDCKVSGTACHGGLCNPDTCVDGQTTPVIETDKDCGGPCAPCADGLRCSLDADCKSNICKVPPGGMQLRCIPPTCADGVKNEDEPTKDCGGTECAAKCAANDHCLVPSDCMSGVCSSGACVAANCTDAVQNANEIGVDCGGGCAQCLP